MQVIHDFAVEPQEYFLKGKDNDFPVIEKCPHCHDLMVGHGFYPRYIITIKGKTYCLYIKRFKCRHCGKTVSILPSFLLPYFQRSLQAIFYSLYCYLTRRQYTLPQRQLHFYLQRFITNLPGIMAFFRDKFSAGLKFFSSKKKNAIKLIERIKSFPAHTFSQRYYDHFNTSFMAL